MHRIVVLGASGYSGIELTRLLVGHPGVELVAAASDRWIGDPLEQHAVRSALRYVSVETALATSCDVVMLATPAEASHRLVPQLPGRRVIDLSGAFRLRDATAYARHYGFAHEHSGLLGDAVYGLPELFRARIAAARQGAARLVANPGCYATAIQLALAPVLPLLAPGRIVVDAMSGVTGAGRKATEEMSFAEVAGDLRAYRVLRHQHEPEIEQALGDIAGRTVDISFVPHLLPVNRGILATCHAALARGDAGDVAAAFGAAYGGEAFISLAPSAEHVALHDVVGTNQCRIGFTVGERGELVVIAAIDNLVKGAAGQAVQNLNLLLGMPEQTGLDGLRSFHP